jgi:hypothetical protein
VEKGKSCRDDDMFPMTAVDVVEMWSFGLVWMKKKKKK